MTDQALAPCPFCGEAKMLEVVHVSGTYLHPAYYVRCDNCGGQSGSTDRGDHAEKWNERAAPGPVGAESAWWALVMGAAASLEDAAASLRDPDAKRAAELAAAHYRKAAKNLTEQPR